MRWEWILHYQPEDLPLRFEEEKVSGSPYSPLKIIHHHKRLEAIRRGEQIVPAQVQLIISDLCNQDCVFCAYRMSGYSSNQLFTKGAELAAVGHNNPKRQLELSKILSILDDCKVMGVGAIQLTGGGEPSAHPHFTDVLNAVLYRGLDLALVSNGVNWKERDLLLLSRAKWVRVSIDAGNLLTYNKIRKVSARHWDAMRKNLGWLCDLRDAEGTAVIVGVGFVVTKDNYTEIAECARLARDAGADNIRISAVFQNDDELYFRDFYNEAAEQCREAKKLETERFKVFDNFGERVEDLREHSPDYKTCGYQQFTTYIGGDLNVYRCCVLAYNERGIIGSLKEQSFRQLWESEQKKQDFATFDARGCERCQFNNKNRTIAYALDPDPAHVNYV